MKQSKNLLEMVKTLPFFQKEVVRQFGSRLGVTEKTVDTYIGRFLDRKDLVPLRNGLYVTSDFFLSHKTDHGYAFALANVMRTPSYVSGWSALQYYGLATEAVHVISSVTLKTTKEYRNKAGNFAYQSIRDDLFVDFRIEKGSFDFLIASPAKALFDLLYFRTRGFRTLPKGRVRSEIESLRIDYDEMDPDEQARFHNMIDREYERISRRDSEGGS